MADPVPVLLIPGLNCSSRLFTGQIPHLWRFGPVIIADHTRADSMAAMARGILADAPPRFALAGLSMGGYIAFEVWRQAPERVVRLALLDTAARPDRPDQSAKRDDQIALTRAGRFNEIPDLQFPLLVHRNRQTDPELRRLIHMMAEEVGAEAFIRQQTAIKNRPDSRGDLGAIACPTLVLVGEGDELTPPELASEMAGGIKGSELVIVPDCGHLSSLERPEAVANALLAWMSR